MLGQGYETDTGQSDEGGRDGRQARAVAVLASVVTLVVLLALIGLAARPPVLRASILRNIECLRCHADMLPRLSEASVHQPFVSRHCTSCHGPHGRRRVTSWRRGPGPLRWLQVGMDELGLRLIWDALSFLGLVRDQSAGAGSVTATEPTTTPNLVSAETELCWQCHGGMGPLLGDRVLHPPFEQGRCTSCHDPHASPTSTLLREQPEDLCPACHRIGPELLAADVHLPFGARDCLACHDPHASNENGLLVRRERDLCLGCHPETARLLGRSVRHAPFASGGCTTCHRPHSAAFAALLPSPSPDLCYRCHGAVRGAFTARSRHPVPGRLGCGDCHAAHASAHRGLLNAEQRVLCLRCHGTIRAELGRRHVHAVAGTGPCTACHVPHGSRSAPLLQRPDPALCLGCHPRQQPSPRREQARRNEAVRAADAAVLPSEPRPSRPGDPSVTEYPSRPPRRSSYSHPVSGTGCGGCHEAHASNNADLLLASGDALCLRCHRADVPRFASSRHSAVSCGRCHRVHHAPYQPLVTDRNPELCLRCHRGYDRMPGSHPSSPGSWDSHTGQPLTCTSTCHDPHGSAFHRMLRVPYLSDGIGSDYICLLCHTSVGIDY